MKNFFSCEEEKNCAIIAYLTRNLLIMMRLRSKFPNDAERSHLENFINKRVFCIIFQNIGRNTRENWTIFSSPVHLKNLNKIMVQTIRRLRGKFRIV